MCYTSHFENSSKDFQQTSFIIEANFIARLGTRCVNFPQTFIMSDEIYQSLKETLLLCSVLILHTCYPLLEISGYVL